MDDFPFLQFLAGAKDRRIELVGTLQILFANATLVNTRLQRAIFDGTDLMASDKPINSDTELNAKIRVQRVEAVCKLMCGEGGVAYIVSGFIYNGRILGMQDATCGWDAAIRRSP